MLTQAGARPTLEVRLVDAREGTSGGGSLHHLRGPDDYAPSAVDDRRAQGMPVRKTVASVTQRLVFVAGLEGTGGSQRFGCVLRCTLRPFIFTLHGGRGSTFA